MVFLNCLVHSALALTLPAGPALGAAPKAAGPTMQAASLQLIDDSTYAAALKAGGLVLVDFYADWCGPCRLVEPALEQLADTAPVTVLKAKLDECPDFRIWLLEQKTKIAALPTCVLFDQGKPVRVHKGAFTYQKIRQFVESADPPAASGSWAGGAATGLAPAAARPLELLKANDVDAATISIRRSAPEGAAGTTARAVASTLPVAMIVGGMAIYAAVAGAA